MEVVNVFISLVKCMSPSITERWRDHRDVYKNMEELRKRLEKLNCRKRDIESKRASELIEGETELRAEVKNWLEGAVKIGGEVDGIEKKVKKAKLFRAGLGKLVNLKRAELDELYEKGVFTDGLVIHLPRRGYEKPTTSILGGETTFKRKMEEIWGCLLDDKVAKVGVYGMGGIGKTTALEHTHNRLLKDQKEDFKSVIWVNVSKESSVFKLQDKIARRLDLDLSKDNEVEYRAHRLYAELRKKTRYVLILDDLWEVYSLKEVGIPEPTPENRCKLVVTTQSLEVCCGMSCKPIEMEVLSEDEALKLLFDQVGGSVMSDPKLEVIAKEVVQECGGLPLAIVTIAGILKDKVDIKEWQIISRRFIYDRLSDKKLQECLLYCTLYPEDDLIEREMLIEHLMAEGIIEERKTRQSRITKGHVMLNKLVNVGLLNDACDSEDKKCVKMPDLVRDIAVKITSGSPRYLLKAGVGLRSVPGQENWDDDLEKVSLMGNGELLDKISEVQPTKCRRLSTLLLQRNTFLTIPNCFFLHMRMLNVLDLSETDIYCLPESVSDLKNLTALFLSYCRRLSSVPSLAKLVNLKLLDLHDSGVAQIPDGLDMLTMLSYLNLSGTGITSVSAGTLCYLNELQYIEFIPGSRIAAIQFRVEEIKNLRKLENVKGVLNDLDCFNAFVISFESREVMPCYILGVGGSINMKNTALEKGNKVIILSKFTTPKHAAAKQRPLLLPKDVELLHIERCELNVDNLCELASFKNVTKLTKLTLACCEDIEYAFSYSPDTFPLLQSLEELSFCQLRDFRGVICRESATSSSVPFPHGNAFSSLKILTVSGCPKMKKLHMISLLPNLEELNLRYCSNLTEISFRGSISLGNDEGDEISSSTDMITLPKLKKLHLEILPKLQSLPLIADSVQSAYIYNCPKLRRIPMLDREPFPSSLENIDIDNEFLGSLEWDHPNAKSTVQLRNRASDDVELWDI